MKAQLKNPQLLGIVGLVALALIVAIVGVFVAVLPERSKTSDLDRQIAAAQAQLLALHAVPRQGPAVKATDLFALARAMPDTTDMPGIILDLARAATRTHVSILALTPSAPLVQVDGSSAVPVKVSVQAKWSQLAAFLHALRVAVRLSGDHLVVGGRLFVVDSVQITAGSTDDLQATLNVNAFTYGTPPPPVSTDTTQTTTTPSGSVQAAGAPGSTG